MVIFISLIAFFSFAAQAALASDTIVVEFFYNENCGSCLPVRDIMQNAADQYSNYSDVLIFQIKEVSTNTTNYDQYKEYQQTYGVCYPFTVIHNETNLTILRKSDVTRDNLNETLQAYLAGLKANETDFDVITFDFLVWELELNATELSLPLLTIVLGGADSFNPCAFFILFFLMNLLIHVQSRKRMLLIGSIFIIFSGLFYFLFMFILLNAFLITKEHITILTILVGGVALLLGIFNIKDFFFFKKGYSLSIPESKKPAIYRRMRNLVKTAYLPAVIGGAIFLAISVNFYELICSAILPVAYIRVLTLHNLSSLQYYGYIFFYNVVYVIPLFIIVGIFVITLGRRQLTEWHGQILKLLSGIMITGFGILLLFDYKILENVATPILLLIFSLVLTGIISFLWKNYRHTPEVQK